MILSIFLLFTGCKNTKSQIKTKDRLKINEWSYTWESVNEIDSDKTKISYYVNLINENEKNMYIESIKLVVYEAIKNKIISKKIAVSVNKDIKPNETIQINGELMIDTEGLTESDIAKILPFITDIKVSTDEVLSLKY